MVNPKSLPKELQARLSAVLYYEREYFCADQQLQREIIRLEQSYQSRKQAILAKRSGIIAGTSQPIEGEQASLSETYDSDDNLVEEVEEEKAQPTFEERGIPGFWCQAFQNAHVLGESLDEPNRKAMLHITDVRCIEDVDEGKSAGDCIFYSLCVEFEFSENEYFENRTLRKKFFFQSEFNRTFDAEDLAGTEEEKILWRSPDRCLTHRIVGKTQRNKKTGATRTVEQRERIESFFHFFAPSEQSEEEDNKVYGMQSVDFANFIREELIPRSLDWYLGRVEDDQADEQDFEDNDDDDDDDDLGDGNEDLDEGDSSADDQDLGSANQPKPQCANQ